MCPSSDFKWKTKFTIVILTKNGFQKFHTFYSKLLSKIWIFIWNLLRGTWKGFSFDVYMPFITIFIKIKQPFAWHIYFLVRHLRRYSVLQWPLFGTKNVHRAMLRNAISNHFSLSYAFLTKKINLSEKLAYFWVAKKGRIFYKKVLNIIIYVPFSL